MDGRQVVLVTGGGRGIGEAVVRKAALRGHAVCFSYLRDEAAATRLPDALSENGARVLAVRGDVADENDVTALFERAETALGPVTALVANAGTTGRIGPFASLDRAILRRVVDVNLIGPMLCAQEALRRWEARGTKGCIVTISSIAASLGAPGEYVHYAATKAAIEAFTVGLAKEVAASGTRVNAVAPGTVNTGIHAAGGDPDRPRRVASRIPMGRVGEPEEIANAVLWLLGPEASYITGAVLRVSGGL